jgi:hypothetical protein
MAKDSSFDVVSEIDLQEVDNAINQTKKEITQRYDFKGADATVDFDRKEKITLNAANEYQVGAILDVLQSKLVKRGIDMRVLKPGAIEQSGKRYKQDLTVQSGISKEEAKKIVSHIKKQKLKVQSQIQDDHVRVSGKNRDDLQEAIASLKEKEWDLPLQFINFRS